MFRIRWMFLKYIWPFKLTSSISGGYIDLSNSTCSEVILIV